MTGEIALRPIAQTYAKDLAGYEGLDEVLKNDNHPFKKAFQREAQLVFLKEEIGKKMIQAHNLTEAMKLAYAAKTEPRPSGSLSSTSANVNARNLTWSRELNQELLDNIKKMQALQAKMQATAAEIMKYKEQSASLTQEIITTSTALRVEKHFADPKNNPLAFTEVLKYLRIALNAIGDENLKPSEIKAYQDNHEARAKKVEELKDKLKDTEGKSSEVTEAIKKLEQDLASHKKEHDECSKKAGVEVSANTYSSAPVPRPENTRNKKDEEEEEQAARRNTAPTPKPSGM